jgi:hypothetical protein
MAKLTRIEAAEIIERFTRNEGGAWEWGDFITMHYVDPVVEKAREICDNAQDTYPASNNEYCSEEGKRFLLTLALQLRSLGGENY